MASSKRIGWIDIAKGIAIVLMIMGHTLPVGSVVRDAIFSFHMPLFFILAGYTFRVRPIKDVMRSSVQVLLIPYFLVFLLRQFVRLANKDVLSSGDITGAFLSFFMSSGVAIEEYGVASVGLIWFLMVLFFARICMNAIEGAFEDRQTSQLVRVAVVLCIGIVGVALGSMRIILPFSFDLVFVACFFMGGGSLFKRYDGQRLFGKWWIMALASLCWVACVVFGDLEMATRKYTCPPLALSGAFLGSFVVFAVSSCIEKCPSLIVRPLEWAGKYSLVILCVHALDRFVTWNPIPLFSASPEALAWSVLVRICVDVLVSYALYRVVLRR